jgi:hypothetical protein
MTNPAIRFIILRRLVRKVIIVSVAVAERAARTKRGKPMPIPKNRKRSIFSKNPAVDIVLEKRAAINKGLQGTTMAPKKKPKKKALNQGFLVMGACALGSSLPTSTLNTSSKLMTSRIPKAIGDTMLITLVNDTWSTVVKINPRMTINRMTPVVMIMPKKIMVVRPGSFPESWLVR